jgi:hypothetical protein
VRDGVRAMTVQSGDLPTGFKIDPAELPLLDKMRDIQQHVGPLAAAQMTALLRKDPTITVPVRKKRIRLLLRYLGVQGRPAQ